MAADGVSTMMPISRFSSNALPSFFSSALHSSMMAYILVISSTEITIGNITRSLPKALARSTARICGLMISRRSKYIRIARHPKNGSSGNLMQSAALSPPISSVRMITAPGAMASAAALYASNCSSSLGSVGRDIYKNSVRNRPTPSAPFSLAPLQSFGDAMLPTTSTLWPSVVTASSIFTASS